MENALNVLNAILESETKMYDELVKITTAQERADHEAEINALKITIKLVEEELERSDAIASLRLQKSQ